MTNPLLLLASELPGAEISVGNFSLSDDGPRKIVDEGLMTQLSAESKQDDVVVATDIEALGFSRQFDTLLPAAFI